MKIRVLTLAAVTLFFTAFARAENYEFKEPFTHTGAFDSGGRISLENVNGAVDVRTWEKNEILIEGEKSALTDEELKLIDLKIDLTSSRAAIVVRLPKRTGGWIAGGNIRASVRFKLTVPATSVLDTVSTVNSSVTLDGLRGPVKASSVNGGIHATHLSGDAHLETVNGAVKADFASVTAGQKLSFETVNGPVVVRLPASAGVEFHSSSVNGSTNCDFPLEVGKKHHAHNLSGKIGDGRASLDASTVNGSITLNRFEK